MQKKTIRLKLYTMVAAPVGDPIPFFKSSSASDGSVNLENTKVPR